MCVYVYVCLGLIGCICMVLTHPPIHTHPPPTAGDNSGLSTGIIGGASGGSSSHMGVPSFEGKGPLLRHLLRTEAAYVERLRGFKVRTRVLWFGVLMYGCICMCTYAHRRPTPPLIHRNTTPETRRRSSTPSRSATRRTSAGCGGCPRFDRLCLKHLSCVMFASFVWSVLFIRMYVR